jgi:hypothetical protein
LVKNRYQHIGEVLHKYFKVPETIIYSIDTKLVMKIYDEYENFLIDIYSIRFKGVHLDRGTEGLVYFQPNKKKRKPRKVDVTI